MATQTLKIQNTLNPNGKVFELERIAAEHSVLVRMLLEDFHEVDLNEVVIPISVAVSDECLTNVFAWVNYHKDTPKLAANINRLKQSEADETDGPASDDVISWTYWDEVFLNSVNSKMLFEILLAANYLDIKPLYEMGCQFVADMIQGKASDEVRDILDIENDFTPDLEQAIREEKRWMFVEQRERK